MEFIFFTIAGILIGTLIGWMFARLRLNSSLHTERENNFQKYNDLEKEHITYKANLSVAQQSIEDKSLELEQQKNELRSLKSNFDAINQQLATARALNESFSNRIEQQKEELELLKTELKQTRAGFYESNQKLAAALANNQTLNDKINREKKEIEELGRKFNTEFENIANKILETKTEKFTELNKSNLKDILEPLGLNINEFKKKVEDVYEKEAKERFSLGEKVQELALLNKLISDEARNLTKALKGESKTQGRWGEMILESILEKSGLVKGREYFMEHELQNEDGSAMKSDSEGKKMRPDALIKYPDNRSVIIDSKVSLNAFVKLTEANDNETQATHLKEHIQAVKNHIQNLSTKGYDDYNHALDFVMLFIPNEAAYSAAMQGDSNLWSYAYDKRILLISPTNLITSLKLIVDLWKREYQNKNAQAIARDGAALYDKFVLFIENLKKVGASLDTAQERYQDAYKQLCTGKGNLVKQASELKKLGLKTKKEIPNDLINADIDEELSDLLNNQGNF